MSPEQGPADVLPDRRRHNSARFVPRASRELEAHYEEYQLLHEALEPVFIWIQSLVCAFAFYQFLIKNLVVGDHFTRARRHAEAVP